MQVEVTYTIDDVVEKLEHPTENGFVVIGFGTCQCFEKSANITISMPCPCVIVEMKTGVEFRKKIPPFQAAILAAGVLNEEDAKNLQNHKTSPFVFVTDNGKVRFLGGNTALEKWVKDNPGAPKPARQETAPPLEDNTQSATPSPAATPTFQTQMPADQEAKKDQNTLLVNVRVLDPSKHIKLTVPKSITGKQLKAKINPEVSPREVATLVMAGKELEDGMQLNIRFLSTYERPVKEIVIYAILKPVVQPLQHRSANLRIRI